MQYNTITLLSLQKGLFWDNLQDREANYNHTLQDNLQDKDEKETEIIHYTQTSSRLTSFLKLIADSPFLEFKDRDFQIFIER